MNKSADIRRMFCPHLGLSISESVSNDAAIIDKNNNTPDYIEVGICDWARKSSSYKKMLEHTADSNTSPEEIVKQFINIFQIKMVMGKTAQCWSWQPSPWDEFNLLNAVQEIEICRLSKSKFCSIIYDYFWAKHSSEKVLQLNCISYYDLKLAISIFLKIKRIITKLNKNISKRREPDYTNEVFLIKNYMEKHFGEKITLRNIYNEIKNSTENWKNISKTTISRLLRTRLRLSYKKSTMLRTVSNFAETKWVYLDAVSIQLQLERDHVEVIYADEFSL